MKRVLPIFSLLILGFSVHAENWAQWRGPAFNGSTTETNLPEALSPENQAWAADLPGPGAATPIIWEDRVFISSVETKTQKLLALCYARKDGKLLWQKETGLTFSANGQKNDGASPSPVTDGKKVIFYYGTGDLTAFDMDGNQLWTRNLQKEHGTSGRFNFMWGYSSSPLLYKGKLYVPVLQRDTSYADKTSEQRSDSFLLALDPETGKDIWKQVRPNDAKEESKESYGTPVPFENNGHTEILVGGGDCVTAHDPDTGKELWRCGGWNPARIGHWRLVSSPVAGEDIVIACPPKGGAAFGIKDGGSGDVTATNVAWKTPDASSDVAVPLYYQNKFFFLNGDKKTITSFDPKTGEKKAAVILGGTRVLRASPTGADGKVYCMNEAGDVWVVGIGDELKILYKGTLGSTTPARASIAVAHGQVFVRTAQKLYVFAKKS